MHVNRTKVNEGLIGVRSENTSSWKSTHSGGKEA